MPVPALDLLPDLPITPSDEAWRALSAAEQARFVEQVISALQREEAWMSEGTPHFRAKVNAVTTLGDHFARAGRQVYLACELPVLYPGERPFAPDLLAVVDVPVPGDEDLRTCWSVTTEGRGLDLILEVHYAGDKQKDLVTNVARYARLGVPEYFVYDRMAQRLYGYRLGQGRQYQSIPPRRGTLSSWVLGLDLGILDNRLRFFANEALIPESRELLARLEHLMDERERDIAAEVALRQELEQRLAAETEARGQIERRLVEAEARANTEAAARAALEAELATLRARLTQG